MSKNTPSRPQGDALEKLAKWGSYVTIGDSFAEGMMDPADPENPDNLMFGWVNRLVWELSRRRMAVGLTSLKCANPTIRGRKLPQIATEQIAVALGMHPALISIIGGGSDLVRVPRGPDHLSRLVESMAVSTRETGANVLLGTIQGSKGSPIISSMHSATVEFNANIWSIAQRHGCYVLDQWGLCPIRTMNPWAPDRFHLKPIGHEPMINHALRALGLEPCYPEHDQVFRDEGITKWTSSQNREWVKNHLVPWIKRHARGHPSGDGHSAKFPHLTVLNLYDLPVPPVTLQ